MADEPKSYGSPMGVEAPGQSTASRPKAKEASPAERKAALKALEARSQGEARRDNTSGRGTSQGDRASPDNASLDPFSTIKKKKYQTLTESEKE